MPIEWFLPVPRWLPPTLIVVGVLLRVVVTLHVVLTKRPTRAAIGWAGLILFAPYTGAIFYLLFGINRIHRRARSLRPLEGRSGGLPTGCVAATAVDLGEAAAHLAPLARTAGAVTSMPLLAGNAIAPLVDGDEAYPAMLEAIGRATRSVALSTYIFYDDPIGRRFVAALGAAAARGVAVRVLVDDFGARYGWRGTIVGPLRGAGVTVATFLPTLVPNLLPYLNLRNHRKILVCDGREACTGGMNIDARFVHHATDPAVATRAGRLRDRHHDLHFRIRGPVVAELMRVFADDWAFATGERLDGDAWFPTPKLVGPTAARCVADGPEDDVDPLLKTVLAAVAAARRSVVLVTPYFFPDEPLIAALELAVLRGVTVEVLVPRRSNLRLVQWAMPAALERAVAGGCRVGRVPPPFDHAKLMVVDDAWTFLGSANIDPRSFRLNFEVNVECYGPEAADAVRPVIESKRLRSRPLTPADLHARPWPVRVRDGVFRLLEPYL